MRTTLLVAVLKAARVMALMVVAMALPVVAVAGGQGADEEDARVSGSSGGNGQIVFRRYFDAEQTEGALFVMNPDGSHVRQITHPPEGWRDNVPAWSPEERGSSSSASSLTRARVGSCSSTPALAISAPSCRARGSGACTPSTVLLTRWPFPCLRSYGRPARPPDPPEWQLYSAIFVVGLDGSDPHQVSSTPEIHRDSWHWRPPTRRSRLTARCSLSCALAIARRRTVLCSCSRSDRQRLLIGSPPGR